MSLLTDKPKLNVEPCVVKNTLPVKAAMKRKAPERTAVAEVKPMSSAITCSEDQKAPGMVNLRFTDLFCCNMNTLKFKTFLVNVPY